MFAIAVEVKGTYRVRSDHLKGLRAVAEDHPKIRQRILGCCEQTPRQTEDGILILNHSDFIDRLWAQEIVK